MRPLRGPRSRGRIRRVVVVAPSAFTLANLFFGVWAIITASRGNFRLAAWLVVLAGVLDMLDGRIARLSNTGSRFGAELDSLVDGVSFGVAPALLMYFLEFQSAGHFGWVVCYLYIVATALRLARFNVVSAPSPTPGWFTGLPSPAAGITLAVYYPFSQTRWYEASLAYLDLQHQGLVVLIVLMSVLMVSTVKYPRLPRIGVRTVKGWAGLGVHLAILAGAILAPATFLFPLGLAYLTFGIVRSTALALGDRGEPVRPAGETEPQPIPHPPPPPPPPDQERRR